MKYITLTASEVVDGKRVEVGKEDGFPIAESIEDVLNFENEERGWNADEIVAAFNYGSRVKRQAQLRALNEAPSLVKTFKQLTATKQEEILREHGLL